MENLKVKLTFTEPVLGTCPSNEEIYREFIGSKAEDAVSVEDEVAALGADAVAEKGMTIFPKDQDGTPFFWDYQIKGFFKSACAFLKKADGSISRSLEAHKKEIDGLIFVFPRRIRIEDYADIRECQRPLRAQTPQGERISLAMSEEIPAGASITFDIRCLNAADLPLVREWLDFGALNGIGQWRNSGKGRFIWEELSD